MALHVKGVFIRVEVGIAQSVMPPLMAEDRLGDGGAGRLIEQGGGGMAEEPGMERPVDAELVGCSSKDILQGTGRDPLVAG